MSYSQNNEEEVIVRALDAENRKGMFLDIGAYDGKRFSNTLRLAELGWDGVCVEPGLSAFLGLLKTHGDNPRIRLIHGAVGPHTRLQEFHDSYGDAVSTTDAGHRAKWAAGGVKFQSFLVPVVSLDDLLCVGREFAFINIDVEGVSYELFLALGITEFPNLRCLCVEHDTHADDIAAILKPFGFRSLLINAENIVLAKD